MLWAALAAQRPRAWPSRIPWYLCYAGTVGRRLHCCMSPTLGLAPYLNRLRSRLDSCDLLTEELSLAAELVDFLIVLDQTGRLTYDLVQEAVDSLDGMPVLDREVNHLKEAVQARRGASAPTACPGQDRSA